MPGSVASGTHGMWVPAAISEALVEGTGDQNAEENISS